MNSRSSFRYGIEGSITEELDGISRRNSMPPIGERPYGHSLFDMIEEEPDCDKQSANSVQPKSVTLANLLPSGELPD